MTSTTAPAPLPLSAAGEYDCTVEDGRKLRPVTVRRYLVDETVILLRVDGWNYRIDLVDISSDGDVWVTLIRQTRKGHDYKNRLGISTSLADLAASSPGGSPQRLAGVVARIEAAVAAVNPVYSEEAPAFTTTPDIEAEMDRNAASWDAAKLADEIRAAYPATGGRDGFLTDPGGWIAYLGLTDDDATAKAAIELIWAEVTDAPLYDPAAPRVHRPGQPAPEPPAVIDVRTLKDAPRPPMARVGVALLGNAASASFAAFKQRYLEMLPDMASPTEALAPAAPLGRITFHEGHADAPQCPCGNATHLDGFRPVTVRDTADGKVGTFSECDDAWFAAGRHVACLADGCLRVWSDADITADSPPEADDNPIASPAAVLYRLHHVEEAAQS